MCRTDGQMLRARPLRVHVGQMLRAPPLIAQMLRIHPPVSCVAPTDRCHALIRCAHAGGQLLRAAPEVTVAHLSVGSRITERDRYCALVHRAGVADACAPPQVQLHRNAAGSLGLSGCPSRCVGLRRAPLGAVAGLRVLPNSVGIRCGQSRSVQITRKLFAFRRDPLRLGQIRRAS